MKKTVSNGKRHTSPESLDAAVKSICDIMRRSNCAGALQYVPELTWILFLRILDERETHEGEEAEALGLRHKASIPRPYRWRDWAAPAQRGDQRVRRHLTYASGPSNSASDGHNGLDPA